LRIKAEQSVLAVAHNNYYWSDVFNQICHILFVPESYLW